MATKTLDQIMAEYDPVFAPSRSLIQQQMSALPGQFDADLKGLEATAARANESIVTGARRRGVGFSGIPVGEQAQYNATEFMPAVARLKQGRVSQEMSLQEALNQLAREQRGQAQNVYQTELAREQQERQFQQQLEAQRRTAAAIARPTLGSFGGGGNAAGASPAAGRATMTKDANGFSFRGPGGEPITAAQYAQAQGVGYRELLSRMASEGDVNSQIALQYVGNDALFGRAPRRFEGALNALGARGDYFDEAAPAPIPLRSLYNRYNSSPA